MHKIDTDRAAVEQPPISPDSANTPGWFQDGDPTTGSLGTVISADWLNSVQAELLNAIEAAGIVPDKTKTNQLEDAILTLIDSLAVNGDVEGSSNRIVRTLDAEGFLGLSGAELDETDAMGGLTSLAVGANLSEKDPSAVAQFDSSSKGLLVPRMTIEERDAIEAPAEGLLIFNTTTRTFNVYRGTAGWSGLEAKKPPIVFSASGPYYVEGPQDGVLFERAPYDLTLTNVILRVWYAGLSGATRVDLKVSTDNGATWTSVFSVLPGLHYSLGNYAELAAELDPTKRVIAAGSLLRLDITDVQQGGDGFALYLEHA